jgi:hypothetical protein
MKTVNQSEFNNLNVSNGGRKLNQSNENSNTKKGRHLTHKGKVKGVLREKMGKQSIAWPLCQKYG